MTTTVLLKKRGKFLVGASSINGQFVGCTWTVDQSKAWRFHEGQGALQSLQAHTGAKPVSVEPTRAELKAKGRRIAESAATPYEWIWRWMNFPALVESAKTTEAVTPWFQGDTAPERKGWYERMFSDGVYRHWWDGSRWLGNPGGQVHWRQKGDYPCWRGLLKSAQRIEVNAVDLKFRVDSLLPVGVLSVDVHGLQPDSADSLVRKFAGRELNEALTSAITAMLQEVQP